jgi:hypothetical protein
MARVTRGKNTALSLTFLCVCALGLALYVITLLSVPSYSITAHAFRVSPLRWIGVAAAFFLLLSAVWLAFTRTETGVPGEDRARIRARGALVFLPLVFFFLAPFLLNDYLTRDDLRTRLVILMVLVVSAMAYLWAESRAGITGRASVWEKGRSRWEGMPRRKKKAALFAAAFIFYYACSWLLVSEKVAFTGDEPTYLLITRSLAQDGDINIADNYDRKEYVRFFDMDQNPLMRFDLHARRGRQGANFAYPINMPGTSVLILPFYAITRFFGQTARFIILRGSLAIWAALLGVQLYLLALRLWDNRRIAFRLWALFSFTAPVLFYATHLYPELPIAFFSIYVYRMISAPRPPSRGQTVLCGLMLASFPWFGLKYVSILWPLVIVAGYYLLKVHKAKGKFLGLLGAAVLSQALFFYFTFTLYGSISPISLYEGVPTAERAQALKGAYLAYPFKYRIESFLDYFLDQRDGLLPYAPIYFFSFLGLIDAFRRKKRDVIVLLGLALPYIATHALFSQRQGFCPPGRNLTAVCWVAAVLLGYVMAHNKDWRFTFLFRAAGLWSLVCAGLLLFHPSFLYQPTTTGVTTRPGELFVFLSNIRFFLPSFLPSFLKIPNAGYLPNFIWGGAVVLVVAAYAVIRPRRERPRLFAPAAAVIALAAAVFLWVLPPRSVLYPTYPVNPNSGTPVAYYLFPIGPGVVPKPSGELYLHVDKSYKILFNSRVKLTKLKLVFGSDKGEHDVDLRFFDQPIFSGTTSFARRQLEIPPPAFYRYKSLYLYELNITLKQRSRENMRIDPFYFNIVPISE